MLRRMMKSKIHRAVVTDAHLDYVGSVSIDPILLSAADIMVGEQVQIVDIDNGARFETYAIEGSAGQVCLNGAAARLVHPGDKVIIITYADLDEAELLKYRPIVVHVDSQNRQTADPNGGALTGGPAWRHGPDLRPARGATTQV